MFFPKDYLPIIRALRDFVVKIEPNYLTSASRHTGHRQMALGAFIESSN